MVNAVTSTRRASGSGSQANRTNQDAYHTKDLSLISRICGCVPAQVACQAAQFSHSLESLIGEQARAGLAILDLYEDRWSEAATPLSRFSPVAFATLAVKAKLST
jgi:hypothetical protein